MFRSVLIGLLFMLAVAALYGQDERRVRVGLAIGPGLSNFITDDHFFAQKNQWRLKFHAAVFQDFHIKKPFYIQTEVNYSAMGTAREVDLTDSTGSIVSTGNYNYNLHYVQIPVLFKLKFGKNLKGYVALGTYAGFLVAAKGGINIGDKGSDQYPVVNILDDYITFDTGLKFHAGLEVPILNEQRLIFEGRYTQGFLDISDATSRDWNGAFTLMVGYMFEL